jgi:hypothetical protein
MNGSDSLRIVARDEFEERYTRGAPNPVAEYSATPVNTDAQEFILLSVGVFCLGSRRFCVSRPLAALSSSN